MQESILFSGTIKENLKWGNSSAKENEIDEASFTDKIEEKLDNFKHLNKNPNNLSKLNNSDLSMFRHILAQIEDDYKKTYPKAISNLWKRLFIIEDNRTVSNLN